MFNALRLAPVHRSKGFPSWAWGVQAHVPEPPVKEPPQPRRNEPIVEPPKRPEDDPPSPDPGPQPTPPPGGPLLPRAAGSLRQAHTEES